MRPRRSLAMPILRPSCKHALPPNGRVQCIHRGSEDQPFTPIRSYSTCTERWIRGRHSTSTPRHRRNGIPCERREPTTRPVSQVQRGKVSLHHLLHQMLANGGNLCRLLSSHRAMPMRKQRHRPVTKTSQCQAKKPCPQCLRARLPMSGRQDSNLRLPGPKPGALAKLSYAPNGRQCRKDTAELQLVQ